MKGMEETRTLGWIRRDSCRGEGYRLPRSSGYAETGPWDTLAENNYSDLIMHSGLVEENWYVHYRTQSIQGGNAAHRLLEVMPQELKKALSRAEVVSYANPNRQAVLPSLDQYDVFFAQVGG